MQAFIAQVSFTWNYKSNYEIVYTPIYCWNIIIYTVAVNLTAIIGQEVHYIMSNEVLLTRQLKQTRSLILGFKNQYWFFK